MKKVLKEKGILTLVVIMALGFVLCGCSGGETAEQSEPEYATFGVVKVITNPESDTYVEVATSDDLQFKQEEDGEIVDWTSEEKANYWKDIYWDEPYTFGAIQADYGKDIIVVTSLPLDECAYANVDEYAAALDYDTKEDFSIGDTHACVFYFDEDGDGDGIYDYSDSSLTVFYYGDKMYNVLTYAVLTDVSVLVDEVVKTIQIVE